MESSADPAEPSPARRRLSAARTVLLAVVAAGALAALTGWTTCGFRGCPDVQSLRAYQPGGAPVLLDRHGEPFASLAPVKREVVPMARLPAHLTRAFIAVEDQRFYEHHGLDWHRLGGALLHNLRARSLAEGSSTITMQLARNLFPEDIPAQERTLRRKLLEIRIARAIEAAFSKDEILELYLNYIYFGHGAYGVEAASRYYFGHAAERVTVPQAALLAALPKAPRHYDPTQRPRAARARRNVVLRRMAEQGLLSRRAAEAARQAPLGLGLRARRAQDRPAVAPYFVEEVRRRLEEEMGTRLYAEPLRIATTLDVTVQRAAEEALARGLAAIESGQAGRFTGPRYRAALAAGDAPEYLQGAVVVLEVESGDVLAWVGGRDFDHSQFDRVARAKRHAGSAFKPFVYAAALERGYALSQPLRDAPLRVTLPDGKVWKPRNLTDTYDGRLSVREALVRSKNVPTVRLARAVGYDAIVDVARRAGIESGIPMVAAMPLGAVAVSPLELTAAFTAFAGLGTTVRPRLIARVETQDGRRLWTSQSERRSALDRRVAFLITDVLRDALDYGSGEAARLAGFRGVAAGKTGTSSDGVDAWFVGYTRELVAGVWVGFDRPRSITRSATGGRIAAPVWGRLMAKLHGRRSPGRWVMPDGIVVRDIDPATGLVVADGCWPEAGRSYPEIFLAEGEPHAYCPDLESPPQNGFAVSVQSRVP